MSDLGFPTIPGTEPLYSTDSLQFDTDPETARQQYYAQTLAAQQRQAQAALPRPRRAKHQEPPSSPRPLPASKNRQIPGIMLALTMMTMAIPAKTTTFTIAYSRAASLSGSP